jgi:hypothetical protein
VRTRTMVISVAVVVFVLAGILFALNVRASDPLDQNEVDHYEGSTVPFDPAAGRVLAEAEPIAGMPTGTLSQHRVDHYRGRSEELPLAKINELMTAETKLTCGAAHREGWKTTDTAYNRSDQYLYSMWLTVTWCHFQNKTSGVDWGRDGDVGDQFWNLYKENFIWRAPVTGGCANGCDYSYRRQTAIFEAAWLGQVFYDDDSWVSMTARGNGTIARDYKGLG